MTKQKDSEAIQGLIIELAKANDWLSRKNLEERNGTKLQTTINYIQNDISELIDTQDFTELVGRGKEGKGKTNIEKYRLKPGLDNLRAVFMYLNDSSFQKRLIQTEYFKAVKPEIENKIMQILKQRVLNKELKKALQLYSVSPTAINFLLNMTEDTFKNGRALVPQGFRNISSGACLGYILNLCFLIDITNRVLTEDDYLNPGTGQFNIEIK